jgi:23S rRNA (guanine745-N1)-methyltransferase
MPDLRAELNPVLVAGLTCPVCGAPLGVTEEGRSLACSAAVSPQNPKGRAHLFDGGAGGYVNLAPRHSGGGDAKEAVRARSAFLRSGYYAPAAAAIVALVGELTPAGCPVLDAGCGEGYYSNAIAVSGYPTLGVDLSKFAVDAAAKAARAYRLVSGTPSATLYAVGSVFELPVANESFSTVTNIFAPCAPAEYARVLKPGGHLIVAGAGERHLFGLKQLIYDDPYLNDPRRDLPAEADGLRPVEVRNVTFTITVEDPAHMEALFSMTPYYWRTGRDGHSRLRAAGRLETEVSFDLHVYEKY